MSGGYIDAVIRELRFYVLEHAEKLGVRDDT
jgi:hypothetical protein